MTYGKFAMYNVLGAVLWVGGCTMAGYLFGNIPIIKENFSLVVLGIVIASVIPIGLEFFLARRKASKPSSVSKGAGPEVSGTGNS